jgi:hypothetical protein
MSLTRPCSSFGPDGYLGIAARGVIDTDELVRHLKATFR